MTSHSEPQAAAVRHATAADMRDAGAVAVVRLRDCQQVLPVAEALLAGGVRIVELTLTTTGALPAIATLERAFGAQLLVGVGSVRSAAEARDALDAGARFLVSPVGDLDVLAAGHAHGVPVALGAFTPTEMSRVHDAGADFS